MKLFTRSTKKTLVEFRQELARAHMMIAMLAAVIILLVSIGTTQLSAIDVRLAGVCVALLTVVAVISLYMSVVLFRKKA